MPLQYNLPPQGPPEASRRGDSTVVSDNPLSPLFALKIGGERGVRALDPPACDLVPTLSSLLDLVEEVNLFDLLDYEGRAT